MIYIVLTICLVVAFELVLRVAGFSRPYFYMYDPKLGWKLRPGYRGRQTREGNAYIRTNSLGFRGPEYKIEKTDSVFRVAVLGTSTVDAIHVPEENIFFNVAKKKLQSSGVFDGKTIEMMNFGVRGYNTTQEYLVLKNIALNYKPDLVLLSFSCEYNIVGNSPELNPKTNIMPFFRLDNSEKLLLDSSFSSNSNLYPNRSFLYRVYFVVRDRMRIVQLLDIDVLYRFAKKVIRGKKIKEDRYRGMTGLVTYPHCYYPQDDPGLLNGWNITEKILIKMKNDIEKKGAKLAVFSLSTPLQSHPDRKTKESFLAEAPEGSGLFVSDEKLEELCNRNEIKYLSIGNLFSRHAESTGAILHGFDNTVVGHGHWNDKGHEFAGELIAEWLSGIYELK